MGAGIEPAKEQSQECDQSGEKQLQASGADTGQTREKMEPASDF